MAGDSDISVAHVARRPDISSPVGTVLQKSLHFTSADTTSSTIKSALAVGNHPNSAGAGVGGARSVSVFLLLEAFSSFSHYRPKRSRVRKVDVAIQTENDIVTDESPSFKAVPSPLRKYEVIGDDPDLFNDIDSFVVNELGHKRYL